MPLPMLTFRCQINPSTPPKPAFTTLMDTRVLNCTLGPRWLSTRPCSHPSSSHEVAHSGLVQERSTGIPLASALGGPLYPPASRPGATVPQQTPLLPPPHPAGGRARGPRPHFPLRPSLQARSDPPAHRRPRSPTSPLTSSFWRAPLTRPRQGRPAPRWESVAPPAPASDSRGSPTLWRRRAGP